MISINTNYAGNFAAKAVRQSQGHMDQAMERLSTGKRINYARDDAAGQSIATRLTAEVQGLSMAARNASDGQSLLDTAEGALQEVHTLLLRMRELAVQSSNDTVMASDRTQMQAEVQSLEDEIDRIGNNTTWGGKDLFVTTATVKFQIGPDASDDISVTIKALSATGATGSGGLGLTGDVTTQSGASSYITKIDAAISIVSTNRGDLGAVSNRLGSTVVNLDQIKVNLMASQGRIEDADFAAETGNLAKSQILQQAATAMLAQANASKQTVLTLIR